MREKLAIITILITGLLAACDNEVSTVSTDLIEVPPPPIASASPETDKTAKPKEQLLSETENAYNPIPSPDGRLIAYVRTGWGRPGGSGGTGRSNLVSEISVMDLEGNVQTENPLADAFLETWSSDGRSINCFRDGEYSTVALGGTVIAKGKLPRAPEPGAFLERVSFPPNGDGVLWVKNYYKNVKKTNTGPGAYSYSSDFDYAALESSKGEIAKYGKELDSDALLIPSPNGRYIAIAGVGFESHLLVFDRQKTTWSDFGEIVFHPDGNWDYIKPSWNPWFADSSRLVFATKSGIVAGTPDGKSKTAIVKPAQASGIPVPSPNGEFIAYVTFEPTPTKFRSDMKFWGDSTIWVIATKTGSKPAAVTKKNADSTFCLRWLNNSQLVFDRIADEISYKKARLWTVEF